MDRKAYVDSGQAHRDERSVGYVNRVFRLSAILHSSGTQ